jgi:AraC-like DNA-binding protein
MRTFSVLGLRPVCLALKALGFEPSDVVARVALDAELLTDPDARIPATQALAVFAEATRLTGIAAFGLRAALAVPPGALEVVDVAARSASTLRAAIERFARYYALIDDGATIEIVVADDGATLIHRAPRSIVPPPAAVEMLFGLVVLRTRGLVATPFPMRAVRFIHEPPADASEHERFFGVPVTFGWPRHELVFASHWLDAPIASADPVVAAVVERFIRSIVGGLDADDGVVGRVRAQIAELMAAGPPRLETVAARLKVSARSLQRKLRDAGRPFASIVDEVRREAALSHLAKRDLSIGEVGYLLGFSEPSAFHRAFKRWTGIGPSDYRKGAACEGAMLGPCGARRRESA